jgi:hypothetical protein
MMRQEDVMIAAPCSAKWDDMQGAGAIRFCHLCELNVYDTKLMSEAEISELMSLNEQNGRQTCLKLYRRADGTLLTRDCPIGRRIKDRCAKAGMLVRAAVLLVLGWLQMPMADADGQKKLHADDGSNPRVGEPVVPVFGQALSKQDFVANDHAEPKACQFFKNAHEAETAGNIARATGFYEDALKEIDRDRSKHDSSFVKLVAGDYCKLLRQTGKKERADEMAKKYRLK